jgi:hypothetical protein
MSWRLEKTGSCSVCAASTPPLVRAGLSIAGQPSVVLCEACIGKFVLAARMTNVVAKALTKALEAEHRGEIAARDARLDQLEALRDDLTQALEQEKDRHERIEGERDRALEILAQIRTTILGNLSTLEESRGG